MAAFLTLMKGFLFFSKVGFMLNIVFFVCVIFWLMPHMVLPQALTSLLIIAGWPLSLLVNAVLFIWFLYYLFAKRTDIQPFRMFLFNSIVFIFQLIFFFL